MDENKYLILVNGENVTKAVKQISYVPQTKQYFLSYDNGRGQPYDMRSVVFYENPQRLDPKLFRITTSYGVLDNIQGLLVFKNNTNRDEYWRIIFENGFIKTYSRSYLKVEKTCMYEPTIKLRLEYLHKLAELSNLKTDAGTTLLKEYYDKLTFVDENSALSVYLDPENYQARKHPSDFLIFPFGCNASQFNAVENALCNQMSVIQGPPGTGKTQTILNIIANLLIRNRTAQVVSSNNSAVINVHEKLKSPKYDLGFVVALLGKNDNRIAFLQEQTGKYPDLSKYKKSKAELQQMKASIVSLSQKMASFFELQTRLATVKQEIAALELEMCHFRRVLESTPSIELTDKMKRMVSSREIMQCLQEYEALMERKGRVSVWYKLKNAFVYGVLDWRFYKDELSVITVSLQDLYYKTRRAEMLEEIEKIQTFLSGAKADETMRQLEDLSLEYLRAVLYDRYKGKETRIIFDKKSFIPLSVLKEYPIILSSTFSSRTALEDVTYDYVIVDEASQVDIVTGSLALSCARNAVIVGDLKQLSNIVDRKTGEKYDKVFKAYNMPDGYSNSEYSFLKSVCCVIPDVPQTLLREHYRCHPKIIGFCNQKFYRNQLFIMTEDNGETDAITLVRTVVGDHQRGNENQRQADVIQKEILPTLTEYPAKNFGFITPYCAQVRKLEGIANSDAKVDTIHKFQGQEKDIIILSMVDDVIKKFSDSPDLLNVAISRAKKKLFVVMSGNEQPPDSNIQDFMDYVEYCNLEVVHSEIRSIFDLLYRQYTEERLAYLAKHKRVSQYDSENLMYAALTDLINDLSYYPLGIICHQKLWLLIRDFSKLTEEESLYASNPNTHIDFLIYNLVTKKPVLAVEVDGFSFHKEGTRQSGRDKLKDRILYKYGIPIKRVATNGSEEMGEIKKILMEAYAS